MQVTQARPTTTNSALRFLALGDSSTIGEGVSEHLTWPHQLAARLYEHGISIGPPRVIAQTGWTTDELSAAMDAAEPLGEWDFVTLLIGVNNQYRGRPLGEYGEQFEALLQRAIAAAGGDACKVLVLSIPDWGVTPFARSAGRDRAQIAREIDAFNATAREIALDHDCGWLDITDISRDPGAQVDMLADDGLHPSARQYALWVDRILAALT